MKHLARKGFISFVFAVFVLSFCLPGLGAVARIKEKEKFEPVVRIREKGHMVQQEQLARYERLMAEGRRLLQEEMDYEGATKKFEEARALAVTRAQRADVSYYLSLVYYSTMGENAPAFRKLIQELICLDYNREPDELICPPRYVEIFGELKKSYGALKVRSDPAGADVYINRSRESLGKTPLTLGARAGTVILELKKGKKGKKAKVEVPAEKETETEVYTLKGRSYLPYILGGAAVLAGGTAALLLGGEKGPEYGSIEVTSEPPGASVHLDGTPTGQVTNTVLTDITAGSHTVKVVKEGYRDVQHSVTVVKGQAAQASFVLTLHTLTVTEPNADSVWITGEEVEVRWETDSSGKAYGRSGLQMSSLRPEQAGRIVAAFARNTRRKNLRRSQDMGLNLSLGVAGSPTSVRNSEVTSVQKSTTGSISTALRSGIHDRFPIHGNCGLRQDAVNSIVTSVQPEIYNRNFNRARIDSQADINPQTLTNIRIELFKGDALVKTIAESIQNTGSFAWTVVDDLAYGMDYRVKVMSNDEPNASGDSDVFEVRDLLHCFDWVEVPAGWFKMGDNFNEGDSAERPVHDVYLNGYYVSKYEVTFEQYDIFCDATGRTKPSDSGWGRGERPVINVSWFDAKAFCDWLSNKTGKDIHLPTEAQWEKAARGTYQRRYPWGNSAPNSSMANYGMNEGKTMPVGSYPAGVSPYGLHDMAGNVWEWCHDWFGYDYYSTSPSHNPQGPSSGSHRMRRGGSYSDDADSIRSASRGGGPPSHSSSNFGFRLCREK